jgi:hypothetical protein
MVKIILIIAGIWLLASVIIAIFLSVIFRGANEYTKINPRSTHPQRSWGEHGKAIERHREAMRRLQSKLN